MTQRAAARRNWVARMVDGDAAGSGPPLVSADAIPARRAFFELAGLAIEPPASVDVLPAEVLRKRRGGTLTAEVVVPRAAGPHPTVLYLHGGAWCVWSAAQLRRVTFALAERGCVVVGLDYGLAPECPFPCAIEDSIFAARWVCEEVGRYGGDPQRLAIAGDSSGANLAAATVAHLAAPLADHRLDDGGLAHLTPAFSAAALLYGVYDFRARMSERPTTPGTTEIMANLAYLGPRFLERHRDPLVSPACATNLDRFPPTYLCCGDADAVLPQTLNMAALLTDAGVSTSVSVVSGGDHEFLLLDGEREPWARAELERILDWLTARLEARPS